MREGLPLQPVQRDTMISIHKDQSKELGKKLTGSTRYDDQHPRKIKAKNLANKTKTDIKSILIKKLKN
jgi:hypothetical protein